MSSNGIPKEPWLAYNISKEEYFKLSIEEQLESILVLIPEPERTKLLTFFKSIDQAVAESQRMEIDPWKQEHEDTCGCQDCCEDPCGYDDEWPFTPESDADFEKCSLRLTIASGQEVALWSIVKDLWEVDVPTGDEEREVFAQEIVKLSQDKGWI
ncbi:uncharacterized protein LY89DRAFT_742632 [Mollisia scopiformis]|uniref:Uncharacterized protein n=1 Tax=Mollisia scopiformis TaxID=149040 RepID=A0A132B643_MOLSC|nr:uncharacterized protein LY89DRAFT_742632 [Mollisia scopiformis]KUJ07870.1 hypothetical protein LY89DRAFT_742632 [Mollisia scopiformis]